MTDQQWDVLLRTIGGEISTPLPVGFIIDCPWLPNWYGAAILDYFSNDDIWLSANLKAVREFPDVMFLPGFWSEYGMCTEPSAFGVRCTFPRNDFPHAHKVLLSEQEIDSLPLPDPRTDGLLPLVLNRLKLAQPRIEEAGHKIRFAVARGPLNIATYLMGTIEFLTMMMGVNSITYPREKEEDGLKKDTGGEREYQVTGLVATVDRLSFLPKNFQSTLVSAMRGGLSYHASWCAQTGGRSDQSPVIRGTNPSVFSFNGGKAGVNFTPSTVHTDRLRYANCLCTVIQHAYCSLYTICPTAI